VLLDKSMYENEYQVEGQPPCIFDSDTFDKAFWSSDSPYTFHQEHKYNLDPKNYHHYIFVLKSFQTILYRFTLMGSPEESLATVAHNSSIVKGMQCSRCRRLTTSSTHSPIDLGSWGWNLRTARTQIIKKVIFKSGVFM